MFETMGKRRYAMPLVAIIAVFCVMSLVVYPILNATPKNIPFALLSLDEGAKTPAGSVNMGDALVENLSAGLPVAEGQESPIAFTVLDSQEALDEAMENNEYYGAIVIPANFTVDTLAAKQAESQAALEQAQALQAAQAQAGADPTAAPAGAAPAGAAPAGTASAEAVTAPSLTVLINPGKNAMVASTMQSALTTMFYANGIKAEFETVNSVDIGGGAMSSMMSGQMLIMPFVMMTLVASMLLFFTMRPAKDASRSAKYKAFGRQAAYAVVLSLLVAAAAIAIVTWFGGMNLPVGNAVIFLWIASFCMMLLFVGALDIAAPLGIVIVLLVFGCGMSIAMLAPEMLPDLWRNFIYPWVPQHFVGEGLRSIIYRGDGAVNASTLPLVITGCVGLLLLGLAGLIPSSKQKAATE